MFILQMPVADDVKCSWADEVELEGGALPPNTETFENGFKILTEYKYDEENNKKLKIVRTYKIEKRIVSKSIAVRKTWKKFGESDGDKPGPNPTTTVVAEDVYMQFITSKEEDNKVGEESALDKLKTMADKGVVKCRTCQGDHWTKQCPYRDTKLPDDKKAALAATQSGSGAAEAGKSSGGTYVPPSLREGAVKRSDNSNMNRRDDTAAIRISNLSESTTDPDIEDLVKPFGAIHRIFLAKDKATNMCKGFAYVHFKIKSDAQEAINVLNGHGYDHLILVVDWSKPMNSSST